MLSFAKLNRYIVLKASYSLQVEEEEEDEDDLREKISVQEVNSPISVPKDETTFDAFIRDKVEVEHFKTFLEHKHPKGSS